MFSYYGSKSKIAHWYPKPQYDDIFEVFAGSARYSLRYFDRNVTIIDKDPIIIGIWKWLQASSPADILCLPDFPKNLDQYPHLSEVEQHFLGFCWAAGGQYPGKRAGSFISNEPAYWQRAKKRVAESLYKIRHWHIQLGDYQDAPNTVATWFVDPPYQHGGHKYRFGTRQLDFTALRKWIESQKGQIIVCENNKADWMDFKPLVFNQGAQNNNMLECIWTNQPRPVQTSFSFA